MPAFTELCGLAYNAEEHEGHDESPEIEFFAVAKGMGRIGGLFAAVHPEEQEHLVAGVHHGVHTFR
jgi:hypothetical protein